VGCIPRFEPSTVPCPIIVDRSVSYRSFKRVLGESNLERKCRFLFGTSLLLLIMGSFLWYGERTKEIVYQQNPKTARLLVHIIMMHHWKELETNEDFKPVVEELIKYFDKDDYDWNVIRPEANNPDVDQQPQDAFEEELLERWLTVAPSPEGDEQRPLPYAEREQIVVRTIEDSQGDRQEREIAEYHYYQPVYHTESTCVICHRLQNGNLDLSEGDLQAVIKVRIPLEETHAAINRNWALLLATAIITVFLAMILLYVIVRYVIVKPLTHLREVSDEVSRGDTTRRADIQTADEFEDLGLAFNRMLQQLLDSAEELRSVNDNLDAKVDELAQANMKLFEMNRLKGDFLATMSHELRTPLNSILGFSDVLGSDKILEPKQRRYVENIQTSGRVLLDMINDTLDLAKIESGRMEVHLTDFDIATVVSAQCDMARPLAENKNLDLYMEIENPLPSVHQDMAKVRQILNNLLSNAIKFTPEGGRIDVRAMRDNWDRLVLQVCDTGVGIAEEDQTIIFEKFRQSQSEVASDAMTREFSGTGLGLSIVKELCKLLGGEITVESDLGKGSTFTARLPWVCSEQPRLESPLSQELDELTKPPRPGISRHHETMLPDQPPTTDTPKL
jgi:two-component system sensor histidine kinase BarA